MQRQSVTARWAKSRQTPTCSRCPSLAVRVVRAMLVVEADAVVDIVDDRLHARPAARRAAEQRPGEVAQEVGVAVAAAHQDRSARRRAGPRPALPGHPRSTSSGRPLSSMMKSADRSEIAGRRHDAGQPVAEMVEDDAARQVGIGAHRLIGEEIALPRRVDADAGTASRRAAGRSRRGCIHSGSACRSLPVGVGAGPSLPSATPM